MKPSGVAWIGNVPQSWKISRLKYNITCLDERRIPVDAALRNPGPYAYWGAGSIVDYVDNYIFDEELVLLGEDGAPFFDEYRPAAFLITDKIWANNHIHVIKGKPGVCNRFLVHYLNSVQYREYINGSVLNKLTQGNMNEIVCPIPSTVEQESIADFLDDKCAKIDGIIADIEKQIETLQKYKKSLITETVTKGLDKSAPMKDSGIDWIGNIPEHWQVKKLSYECERIGDIDHYMPDSVDEGIPYVMTGDLIGDGNEIDFKNCKQISEQDYQRLSRKMKPILNDIIFARYATIGTVRIVDFDREFLVSYSCAIIRPKKNLHSKYLFYYLKSYAFFEEISKYINTNTQGNVGIDSLGRAKTPIPRLEEQI